MFEPKVSVITVSYNDSVNLERTILSVLEQSYSNIEFLVIDGLSSDNTTKVLDKYNKSIDFFISEKDEGVYDAMNKGIHLSTGTWLIFLNSGDVFFNSSVVSNAAYLLSSCNDLVCGAVKEVWPSAKKIVNPIQPERVIYGMFCSHQAAFISRDSFSDKGYSLDYSLSADYDFFLSSYLAGKKIYITDQVFSEVIKGVGLTTDNKLTSTYQRVLALRKNNVFGFRVFVSYSIIMLKDIIKFKVIPFLRKAFFL